MYTHLITIYSDGCPILQTLKKKIAFKDLLDQIYRHIEERESSCCFVLEATSVELHCELPHHPLNGVPRELFEIANVFGVLHFFISLLLLLRLINFPPSADLDRLQAIVHGLGIVLISRHTGRPLINLDPVQPAGLLSLILQLLLLVRIFAFGVFRMLPFPVPRLGFRL